MGIYEYVLRVSNRIGLPEYGKCRGRDLNARQPRLQRGALPG